MQVPGIDYTEKFAPVAHNATTQTVIAITLKYKNKGWIYQVVNVKAALLKGSIDIPLFME